MTTVHGTVCVVSIRITLPKRCVSASSAVHRLGRLSFSIPASVLVGKSPYYVCSKTNLVSGKNSDLHAVLDTYPYPFLSLCAFAPA